MASTCPLLNLQPILEGTMSSTPAPPSDAVPLKAGTILSAVRWQTQPLGATGRNVIEQIGRASCRERV